MRFPERLQLGVSQVGVGEIGVGILDGYRGLGIGQRLIAEGRSGYAFYILDRGHASVSHEGHEVRILDPGDFFGEIAIIGTGRRTATVTATEPGTMWTLFGTSFRELQSDHPEVASALQEAMTERLAADRDNT